MDEITKKRVDKAVERVAGRVNSKLAAFASATGDANRDDQTLTNAMASTGLPIEAFEITAKGPLFLISFTIGRLLGFGLTPAGIATIVTSLGARTPDDPYYFPIELDQIGSDALDARGVHPVEFDGVVRILRACMSELQEAVFWARNQTECAEEPSAAVVHAELAECARITLAASLLYVEIVCSGIEQIKPQCACPPDQHPSS